jgi:hypothetical protein
LLLGEAVALEGKFQYVEVNVKRTSSDAQSPATMERTIVHHAMKRISTINSSSGERQ